MALALFINAIAPYSPVPANWCDPDFDELAACKTSLPVITALGQAMHITEASPDAYGYKLAHALQGLSIEQQAVLLSRLITCIIAAAADFPAVILLAIQTEQDQDNE